MSSIFVSEPFVEVSVLIILILTLGLTLIMSKRYFKVKSKSLLFWSSGMWAFTIGVLLELVFAFNYYNSGLIKFYLFIVTVIVEFLAMGSVQLLKNKKYTNIYSGFMIITTLLAAVVISISKISNIILSYIVYGILPLSVVLVSSLITFPAAIILAVIAIKSLIKKRSSKMMSILLGVIVVSVAGSLYIVEIPVFLYYSEFIGILLLWYGFM